MVKIITLFIFLSSLARPVFAQGTAGVASFKDLETMFANVVKAATGLAGVALFVMLVVGGYKFLFSGGDMKKLEGARGTITNAIVGLAAIAVAYLILLMIKTITGVDVTQFTVPIK